MQVLRRFLAQEVVDPVDLLLGQHGMNDAVKRTEALRRGAERFFVHDASAAGQVVLAERQGELPERDWWHGEVVHELRVPAQRFARHIEDVKQAAGVVGTEPPAGEQQALRKGIPCVRIRLRPELGQYVVYVLAEVLVRDITAAVAHKEPFGGQQAVHGELVERRQDQPLCQVTGRAKQDKYCRAGIAAGRAASPSRRHGT